jgi:hypothetical protein
LASGIVNLDPEQLNDVNPFKNAQPAHITGHRGRTGVSVLAGHSVTCD